MPEIRMTMQIILQRYEDKRTELAVEAAELVEKIKLLIDQCYKVPQQDINRSQLSKSDIKSTGSILIGFFLRSSHNDVWHKSLSYRLTVSDYALESNGKIKLLRGLSDKQKQMARRRNYRLPTKEDGYCSTETLVKHMTDFEFELYSELLVNLIPLLSMYRYLQHSYRESLTSERLMLRQYCVNRQLNVPNRSTASLEMLRAVVNEHINIIE